jgi:hypothetical protein
MTRPAPALSSLLTLLLATACLQMIHQVDFPHNRVLIHGTCYLILMALAAFLGYQGSSPTPVLRSTAIEIGILALILTTTLAIQLPRYSPHISQPPRIDTGATTQYAATLLFRQHSNPYTAHVTSLSNDPAYQGYKKGPVMIAGYAIAAFVPSGIKIMNVILLALALALASLLVWEKDAPRKDNYASCLFVITTIVLSQRLWYELFYQGINDLLPTVLLLLAILAVKHQWPLITGLAVSLSFSAKFAPAVLLIFLLVGRSTPRALYTGLALGLLPNLPFIIWNAQALMANTVIFHLIKPFDTTSFYNIIPRTIHFVFPLIQIIATLVVLRVNRGQTLDYKKITVWFTILFGIFELTHTEIHRNHLIMFIPFFALIFTWYRHQLLYFKS